MKAVYLREPIIQFPKFEVSHPDVVAYFSEVSECDREKALLEAIEVGVYCLARARSGRDMEFVKLEIERLIRAVEERIQGIPIRTQTELMKVIGSGDGQILKPIELLVTDTSRGLAERLREVKELLAADLDPSKDTTVLGRALRDLRGLIDPARTDSVQSAFAKAVEGVVSEDGALAIVVKKVVTESIKPLQDEMDRLGREVHAQEAVDEALSRTIQKGAAYEEEVLQSLQLWAQNCGVEVHFVGGDKRSGDILVRTSPSSLVSTPVTLVIEVKDHGSPAGRSVISRDISNAMRERRADGGIYLSKSGAGLAKEVGEWAEGECEDGPWVATTNANLLIAIRFLVNVQRLAMIHDSAPEIDPRAIDGQVQRIRTAMSRVTSVNRKVSAIRETADDIQREASAMRDEVRESLSLIDESIRSSNLIKAEVA
jgi:hypothetical protein